METYSFMDAGHAVMWATEVLRRRRFAKISGFYREIPSEMGDDDMPPGKREAYHTWCGETVDLPKEADERFALALRVYSLLDKLPAEAWQLISLRYWGDYHSQDKLSRALREQDLLRQRGVRVRLSYRYSFRQIGTMLDLDHKTVSKRLDKALEDAARILQEDGLLPDGASKPLKKAAG